jgi:lipocalin
MRTEVQALLLASIAFLRAAQAQTFQPLRAVSNLDLAKYQGDWYSVAEIPNAQGAESQCTSLRTVKYTSFGNESMVFTQSCVVSTNGIGVLKREVFGILDRKDNTGLFSATLNRILDVKYEYIVAIVAYDYSYSVVGTSDRNTLFIQARRSEII